MMVVVFSSFTDRRFFVAQKSAPSVTTYLYDQFTDVNGTNLTAHTMDIGGGWTKRISAVDATSGNFTIQSNAALGVAGALYSVTTADATVSDGVMTCDFILPSSSVMNWAVGIVFRWSATGSYQVYILERDAGNTGTYTLYTRNAGSTTLLGAQGHFSSLPTGTETLTLTLNGSSLIAALNTGETLNRTSTFNQTATNMGVWSYVDGTYTYQSIIDNFKFTN